MIKRLIIVWLLCCSAWGLAHSQSLLMLGVGANGLGVVGSGGGGVSCGNAATNFLARTTLTGSDVTNYTNLICGLVTDGIITGDLSGANGCGTKLDVFYLFAAPDATTAQLNICGTNFAPTLHGPPTFTAYQGYTGVQAGNTVYIDTNYNPTTAALNFSTNAAHNSAWFNTTAGQANWATGSADATGKNDTGLLPQFNGDNKFYERTNESLDDGAGFVVANGKGFFLGNRSGASAEQAYHNGLSVGSPNTTAGTIQNVTMYLLCRDLTSSGCTTNSSVGLQICAASFGGSLTSTDVGNFYSRLSTYMSAVGGCASS